MRTRQIAVVALAAAVFGCLMAAEHELLSFWMRALVAAIGGGGLALATAWVRCQALRLPDIALVVFAAAVFGCLMAARHELDSVGARVVVAAIAAGGFAAVVSWILGRGVKS